MTGRKIEFKRDRIKYAAAALIVILLGLISRSGSPLIPQFLKDYAGDTLWALVAYLVIAFLFPQLPIGKVALFAGLFSFTIEVSQLYHAQWIEALRRYRLIGLILGYGFLWSNLMCLVFSSYVRGFLQTLRKGLFAGCFRLKIDSFASLTKIINKERLRFNIIISRLKIKLRVICRNGMRRQVTCQRPA